MKLIYEMDFAYILKKLDDDAVAKTLLRIENIDNKDIDCNWISVSNQEGLLTYISDKKLNEKIMSLCSGRMDTDEQIRDQNNRLTFKNDISITEIKIGRLVQKILSLTDSVFENKDIETFVNRFIGIQKLDYKTFIILSGQDLIKGYKKEFYYEGKGNKNELFKSCMTNHPEYLKIYTENPSVCSMITAQTVEGKIYGRALLWNAEFNGSPIKIMDRVYSVKQSDEQMFRQWAKDNGYICREFNNNDSDTHAHKFIDVNGEQKNICGSTVKLEKYRFLKYPYLDTFKFLDRENGISTNDHHILKNYLDLRATDGRFGGSDDYNMIILFDGQEYEQKLSKYSNYLGRWYKQEDVIPIYYTSDSIDCDYINKNIEISTMKDTNSIVVYSDKDKRNYFRKRSNWSNYHNSWLSSSETYFSRLMNDFIDIKNWREIESKIREERNIVENENIKHSNIFTKETILNFLQHGETKRVFWFDEYHQRGREDGLLIRVDNTYYLFSNRFDGQRTLGQFNPERYGYNYSWNLGSSNNGRCVDFPSIQEKMIYII